MEHACNMFMTHAWAMIIVHAFMLMIVNVTIVIIVQIYINVLPMIMAHVYYVNERRMHCGHSMCMYYQLNPHMYSAHACSLHRLHACIILAGTFKRYDRSTCKPCPLCVHVS